MKNFAYCVSKSEMKIKRADHVQGTVRVHFHSQTVKDIDLKNNEAVDVFGRIGITQEDCKKSNLKVLLSQGLIVLV